MPSPRHAEPHSLLLKAHAMRPFTFVINFLITCHESCICRVADKVITIGSLNYKVTHSEYNYLKPSMRTHDLYVFLPVHSGVPPYTTIGLQIRETGQTGTRSICK